MTFLPIVARELRIAARRRATYWVRTFSGLAVMLAGLWLYLVLQAQPARQLALNLFYVLTGGALLFSLLGGLATADCLSREKREGTLGLLFLTDLRGYDVILGKMVAHSLNAFYIVATVVPLLAVPLIMGGLTPGEVSRMALVAMNALFFSLAAGMLVSAVSRSISRAAGLTLFVVAFFTAILPALGALLGQIGPAVRMSDLSPFLLPSPAHSYALAFDQGYGFGAEGYWCSLLVIHGLGWLFLLLASVITPRVWQDRPANGQGPRLREQWKQWFAGEAAERIRFRRHVLQTNAFYWLVARQRFRAASVWLWLGVLAFFWFWGLAKFRQHWLEAPVYIFTSICLNLIVLSLYALEAVRGLSEERRAETLELLLSTPLSVREIFRGQSLALQSQFVGPVALILGLELIFMFVGLKAPATSDNFAIWTFWWLAVVVTLPVHLVAIYWAGMWQGLTAKNPVRGAGTCLAPILFLPWGAIALIVLIVALAEANGARPPDPSPEFFLGLWFGFGLATDLAIAAYSRHKLLTSFRLAAQRGQEAKGSLWRRLMGAEG